MGHYKGFYTSPKEICTETVDMDAVRKAIKGVYNLRQTVAKYSAMWNINEVLFHMECMIRNNLKDKSRKLFTLFTTIDLQGLLKET